MIDGPALSAMGFPQTFNIILYLHILPKHVANSLEIRKSSPNLGVGTSVTFLCLAKTNRPSLLLSPGTKRHVHRRARVSESLVNHVFTSRVRASDTYMEVLRMSFISTNSTNISIQINPLKKFRLPAPEETDRRK